MSAQTADRRIVLVVDDGAAGRVVTTLLRVTEMDGMFEILRSRDEALGGDETRDADDR